jgi:hypothetical protein
MDEHDFSACVLSDPDSANHATGQKARDIARRGNETLVEIVFQTSRPVLGGRDLTRSGCRRRLG